MHNYTLKSTGKTFSIARVGDADFRAQLEKHFAKAPENAPKTAIRPGTFGSLIITTTTPLGGVVTSSAAEGDYVVLLEESNAGVFGVTAIKPEELQEKFAPIIDHADTFMNYVTRPQTVRACHFTGSTDHNLHRQNQDSVVATLHVMGVSCAASNESIAIFGKFKDGTSGETDFTPGVEMVDPNNYIVVYDDGHAVGMSEEEFLRSFKP